MSKVISYQNLNILSHKLQQDIHSKLTEEEADIAVQYVVELVGRAESYIEQTEISTNKGLSVKPLTDTRNILEQANDIVFKRSEEKEREYGEFSESMAKTARIASELCGKEFTTEDAFKFAMALKLARISNKIKEDSTIDLCAYTAGLQNYSDKK